LLFNTYPTDTFETGNNNNTTSILGLKTSLSMANALEGPAYTPQTQSRLLSLPPELRNRIWRLALVQDQPINLFRNVDQ